MRLPLLGFLPLAAPDFLHKPWSVTDLLRRVREVLDAGPGTAV